jgi:ABC-type lipoprotein release transport system permease subunit
MTVGGIFDLGMPDIERQSLYISLAEARDLFDLRGEATEINISMEELGQEPALIAALKSDLGNQYEIDSWETNYPELQEAIQTKGGVMDIFSVIILLIAGIGILNLLLMAIYERTREIGLLGALGMKPRQISILFLLEGALIGILGVAFGLALGLSINAILGQVGLDYSQFTGMTDYTALISSRIYPSAGLENLAQRGITVLVVAILAAYYPAREASRREPAEALHFV